MKANELNEALKYFTKYNEELNSDYFFHKREDFHIIVFKDDNFNAVYQMDDGCGTCGVELETLEDLKIRFKSFTGEDLECVTE